MPPPASVIVPTRRRRDYLAVALRSVAGQVAEHGAELIVVEDDPADPETEALAGATGARYLAHGEPRGLNAARNTAVAAAGSDLLCFLDDDVDVWPGWLAALLAAAEAHPEHLVFGGPIRARLEGTNLHACGREPLPVTTLDLGTENRDAEFAWGANLTLRRRALDMVGGGFDETLDLYGDEEDLQRRLKAAGGRVRYVAAAGVDHRRADADAQIAGLSRAAYFRGRNSRRYDGRKGESPTLASELRTLAGCAAHSVRDLHAPVTGAFGLLLALLGHHVGWPVARGGSVAITDALVRRLRDLGGEVVCGSPVRSLAELPRAGAVLLDLTPRQVVSVAADRLPRRYARRLAAYRYGAGVFKLDWALDGPVPWRHPGVGKAATVHVGGSVAEVAEAERTVARGGHPQRPFVLFAQASVADPSRAPAGQHTGWAYCHVPHGSTVDMTEAVERQIERFAPAFRDRILARRAMGPAALEKHNPNYVGGDIGGGMADVRQLLARPVLSAQPWRTPVPGLYLCSSSTPPGGGVHGMCGWHAARLVLHDARRAWR